MSSTSSHVRGGWHFVIWLGVASLLTAVAGEAARGVSGPFLKQLGASAAVVGFIAGTGELLGYTLRLTAGMMADRRGGAWRLLFLGTLLGSCAAPLLAIAPGWEVAAALYIAERIGRALRTPARDVLLSTASERIGYGPGFGVHRLLDQAGAVLGPLVVAALYSARGGYRNAFAVLFVPSIAGILVLAWLRRRSPEPDDSTRPMVGEAVSSGFWLLCAAGGLLAVGTADFALISFHYARLGRASASEIPMLYAVAMAVEGVAAAALGFVLQRVGAAALLVTIALSSIAAPLVFTVDAPPLIAVAIWSAGMGGQYALLRALAPGLVAANSRGTAFGYFNTVFGICWFLGSLAMGLLYGNNLNAVVWLAVIAQMAAVPLVLRLRRA